MTQPTETTLRARLEELMQAGVRADMAMLDTIYHEDIEVMDLGIDGRLMTLQKQEFMAMLQETFRDKTPEDHLWFHLHRLTVTGHRGHVLISRKIPVGGPKMIEIHAKLKRAKVHTPLRLACGGRPTVGGCGGQASVGGGHG